MLGEDITESGQTLTPHGFEAVQGLVGCGQCLKASRHDLLSPTPLLGDETGILEHENMLLNSRQAHWISSSKGGHRELPGGRLHHDVPPSGVSQRMEEAVRLGIGELTYNHLVVDYVPIPERSNAATDPRPGL